MRGLPRVADTFLGSSLCRKSDPAATAFYTTWTCLWCSDHPGAISIFVAAECKHLVLFFRLTNFDEVILPWTRVKSSGRKFFHLYPENSWRILEILDFLEFLGFLEICYTHRRNLKLGHVEYTLFAFQWTWFPVLTSPDWCLMLPILWSRDDAYVIHIS